MDREQRELERLARAGDEAAKRRLQASQQRSQAGVIWVLELRSGGASIQAPHYAQPPAPPPTEPEPLSADQWEALTRLAADRGWQGVPPWQREPEPYLGPGTPAWDDPLQRVEQLRGHHARPGTLVLVFEDGLVYRRGDANTWDPQPNSRRRRDQRRPARRRIVRADTEAEARQLASRWPDGLLYLSWLEPERSTCDVLNLAGEPEVLA